LFPDPAFVIPAHASGRTLELRLLDTWGDQHYIGLSSIEVFDADGEVVTIESPTTQVTATPHSVNDLPEMDNDPRTPDKLVDGVQSTCSDLHQWLAPYTPGARHAVTLDFGRSITLGMVRVWNYNKSRIHATRGVRRTEFYLDGALIFQGELRQAPGSAVDAGSAAECIVFTTSITALDAIDAYDAVYEQPPEDVPASVYTDAAPRTTLDPALELVTAAHNPRSGSASSSRRSSANGSSIGGEIGHNLSSIGAVRASDGDDPLGLRSPFTALRPGSVSRRRPRTTAVGPAVPRGVTRETVLRCRVLTIEIMSTWGDPYYIGLTSLQVCTVKLLRDCGCWYYRSAAV
jgi:hypothetical protein